MTASRLQLGAQPESGRPLSRRPIALALLLSLVLALAPARTALGQTGEGKSKAMDFAARAKVSYREGRYEEAASLFKSAYAQVPEPTLLFNAARAYQQGGMLREALTLFRLYLQLANANDAETRSGRADAVEHVATIERSLGAESQRE